MRTSVAALAALTLAACAAETALPKARLTLEKIERVPEYSGTTKPVRAAEGHDFAIAHMREDPARGDDDEDRDWIRSVMEDWDGKKYEARYAGVTGHGSGTNDARPDRIQLVFEVPRTATLRRVVAPEPIALAAERPVRFPEPGLRPRLIHRVEPVFPDWARQLNRDPYVKLEVFVTSAGTVGGAKTIHGHPAVGDIAEAAVRQWKYEPPVMRGKAVPALIVETIPLDRE